MASARARKWLFVSIAVTAAIFILRVPLGEMAREFLYDFLDLNWSTARKAEDFFHERWALAISALVTVYFLYRYTKPENSD